MKLPKGLVRRGRVYWWRRKLSRAEQARRGGQKEEWTRLGTDYAVACRRLKALRQDGRAVVPTRPAAVLASQGEDVTVAVLAEAWLSSVIADSRDVKGQRLARQRVERYLVPALGRRVAASVRKADLRAYRQWVERQPGRSGRPLSAQTVAHVLADCRCLFRWAVDEERVAVLPVPGRWLPRIAERAPDRLTDEEVARLLALPDPYAYVIRLGLETGLRWGELVRAQARDVERGLLVVKRAKSGRVRRVPVRAELVAGRVGRLIPFASASSFAQTVRRLSGVERFHVHMLRHTFACRWLEADGSLAALQEMLGHASIITTQRYGRLSERAVRTEWGRVGGRLAEFSAVAP